MTNDNSTPNTPQIETLSPAASERCTVQVAGSSWRGRACSHKAVIGVRTTEMVTKVVRVVVDNPMGFDGLTEDRWVPTPTTTTMWYCGTHNPIRKAQREAEARLEGMAKRDREEQRRAKLIEVKERVNKALGVEYAAELEYRRDGSRQGYYTGSIAIPAGHLVKLLDELDRLRGIANEFGQGAK